MKTEDFEKFFRKQSLTVKKYLIDSLIDIFNEENDLRFLEESKQLVKDLEKNV